MDEQPLVALVVTNDGDRLTLLGTTMDAAAIGEAARSVLRDEPPAGDGAPSTRRRQLERLAQGGHR